MTGHEYALLSIALGSGVLALVGVWVQFVRYPSFLVWSDGEFRARHTKHCFWISLPVVPALIAQLGGTGYLLLFGSPGAWVAAVHVALVLVSVGSTVTISGPIHHRLSKGKDNELTKQLIRTNVPRTLAWAGHAVFAVTSLLTAQ